MTHKQFEEFILSLPGVWLDYPFGEDVAVYKFGKDNDGAGKMVALVGGGLLRQIRLPRLIDSST